ncbi:hypothetical protein MMC13_002454 [Lambiella insularis]|nr:hypothetical protein [Lambiella insularis]
MATKSEIQDLLRFFAQDAKVSLQLAMPKIKELQAGGLATISQLANSEAKTIADIFHDEKIAKQIISAAKRVSKKRKSSDGLSVVPVKKAKRASEDEPLTAAAIEESLALPHVEVGMDDLVTTVLYTNRAPLVLAFATSLLKYTMPAQPLSSRLSLAQAVVSANARSKAVSVGLEKGSSAEADGWGLGQPKVKVMGREVHVLKRWGYNAREDADISNEKDQTQVKEEQREVSQATLQGDESVQGAEKEPALWGLDLEAMRLASRPALQKQQEHATGSLPIHTAQSARAYLLKSFASPPTDAVSGSSVKKKSAGIAAEKERNLALLLNALDMLYSSWAPFISAEELDRRAWSWYVQVRPEVENSAAGWGGKGQVKLSDVLGFRRKG